MEGGIQIKKKQAEKGKGKKNGNITWAKMNGWVDRRMNRLIERWMDG